MAHAAIFEKGTINIVYFIKDCIQTGRDFRGSNGSVTGVKEHLFDVIWTEDHTEPIVDSTGKQSGFNLTVEQLSPALRYNGHVVSSKKDIDEVTKAMISEKYTIHDEIKIIRQKLAGDDSAWTEYQEYVDGLVKDGKAFKEKNFGGKP